MRHRTGLLALLLVVCSVGSASAQTSPADSVRAARRARMAAAMAAARARADEGARLVDTIVVTPPRLELTVGDSIVSPELMARLQIVGLTAAGDTVPEFAKTIALEPNPSVQVSDVYYVARRAGTAWLWIYIGADVSHPLFVDSGDVTRVQILVR